MSQICTRPCCQLRRAIGRYCECGALTRAARRLRIEVLSAARPTRWDFNAPGTIVIGRRSTSTLADPPQVDLGTAMSDASGVSRRLLTVVWTGDDQARITRVGDRGSVIVGEHALAVRHGIHCALPQFIVINGALSLHLATESL